MRVSEYHFFLISVILKVYSLTKNVVLTLKLFTFYRKATSRGFFVCFSFFSDYSFYFSIYLKPLIPHLLLLLVQNSFWSVYSSFSPTYLLQIIASTCLLHYRSFKVVKPMHLCDEIYTILL